LKNHVWRQSTTHSSTEDMGDRASLQAKIMERRVISERNVVRSDIMVAPLDSIHDTIQTYHWEYPHNYAGVVYTRLVRLFYAFLEVVQDDDRRVVLQSTVDGHTVIVDDHQSVHRSACSPYL
jgi:hypothetical protein